MDSTELKEQVSDAVQRREWLKQMKTTHQHEFVHDTQKDFIDLISFRLMNEIYAIPLIQLQEILKAVNIMRVPRSHPHLKGIINVRGSILTVIDVRKRLGMDPGDIDATTRIVIVSEAGRAVGLLVDAVLEILRIEKHQMEQPPHGIPDQKRQFIAHIFNDHDQFIIIPDLGKLCQFSL
ncbi:MAG: purine-binding chemotaxis protein CheW [SAR324 cluster bacterium]|nr:purine-binding chemotaxis protein CheW [SAR324 cluster bacterium]